MPQTINKEQTPKTRESQTRPFYAQLHSDLTERLALIHTTESSRVRRAEQCVLAVRSAMEQLRQFVGKHGFAHEEEEIQFFKHRKPSLYAQMFFYKRVFKIESARPSGSPKLIRKYLSGELKQNARQQAELLPFSRYYRSGATHLDTQYFLRSREGLHLHGETPCLCFDPEFHTSYDGMVAELLVYEQLSEYLTTELALLKGTTATPPPSSVSTRKPVWTASKAAAVELIYGLYASGAIDHGRIAIKELFDRFEDCFDLKVHNYYHVYHELRNRKKERTPFLRQAMHQLERKMEDDDED